MLTGYLFAVIDEVFFQMILILKYTFNFEIILDLQEKNAKRGDFLCTFRSAPPKVSIYCSLGTF